MQFIQSEIVQVKRVLDTTNIVISIFRSTFYYSRMDALLHCKYISFISKRICFENQQKIETLNSNKVAMNFMYALME